MFLCGTERGDPRFLLCREHLRSSAERFVIHGFSKDACFMSSFLGNPWLCAPWSLVCGALAADVPLTLLGVGRVTSGYIGVYGVI